MCEVDQSGQFQPEHCHLWQTSVSPQLWIFLLLTVVALCPGLKLLSSEDIPPHPHPAPLSLSWLWLPVSFSRAQPAFDRLLLLLLLAARARTKLYIASCTIVSPTWSTGFQLESSKKGGRPTISDNYNVLLAPILLLAHKKPLTTVIVSKVDANILWYYFRFSCSCSQLLSSIYRGWSDLRCL